MHMLDGSFQNFIPDIKNSVCIIFTNFIHYYILWHQAKVTALKFLPNGRCQTVDARFLQWRMNICAHFCIISI